MDFAGHIKLTDYLKNLGENIMRDLKNIYNYYSAKFDKFWEYIKSNYDELLEQAKRTLLDILNRLNQYTDELMNDVSSEPRSLNDYSNGMLYVIYIIFHMYIVYI